MLLRQCNCVEKKWILFLFVHESNANVPLLELAKREGGLFSMAYLESNPNAK